MSKRSRTKGAAKRGRASRAKGGVGEREAAVYLARLWPDAERAITSRGASIDGSEIRGVPYHVEVKYSARPSPHAAMAQALRDARPDMTPLVMTRKVSRKSRSAPWLVTLLWSDFADLVELEQAAREGRAKALEEAANARRLAVVAASAPSDD